MNRTATVPDVSGPDRTGTPAAVPGPVPADAPPHVPAPTPAAPAAELSAAASGTGLRVLASAAWPESAEDGSAPAIAGFVVSSFSPIVAETGRRCLLRRPGPARAESPPAGAERPVTAVVVVSPLGDLAGAVHVAEAVDGGHRLGPLLFFQAVPNAVAGHLAAQWRLTGPVVCVGDTAAGLAVTSLLLADGDADEALLIRVDQAYGPDGLDSAAAVLLGPGPQHDPHPGPLGPDTQPGPEPRNGPEPRLSPDRPRSRETHGREPHGREPQHSREPQDHEGEQP
ncbi:hypothetical protein [Kitasatospora sp. NPDC057015]|uniref:hypothetical protein n=1 Tax=Kitasatospora sp. NPDC057015 TaxID=3346001 RepID=UPI00363F36C9